MKKIVCEICQSSNMKKENGVFVCKECGTEYSLEEVRSLLIDVDETCNNEEIIVKNEHIANSQENKYELLEKLKCWLLVVSKFENFYFWSGVNYSNDINFWRDFPTYLAKKNEFKCISIEKMIDWFFVTDDNSLDRILGESIILLKNKGFRLSCAPMPDLWYRLHKEQREVYIETRLFSEKKYYPYLIDRNLVNKRLRDCDYDDWKDNSIVKFILYWYKNNKNLVVFTYRKDKYGKYDLLRCDHTEGAKETVDFFETLTTFYNDRVNEYNAYFEKMKTEYQELHDIAIKLEDNFFLPYEYRDEATLMYLINIITDGRADNWKEVINIYKDDISKKEIIKGLYSIKDVMSTLTRTISLQLDRMNTILLNIDNNITNVSNRIDICNDKLVNVIEKEKLILEKYIHKH